MKRTISLVLCLVMIFALTITSAAITVDDEKYTGKFYNLKIHAVKNDKKVDFNTEEYIVSNSNGNNIFVPEDSKVKIELQMSDSFDDIEVIDSNGTDGIARFALPDPGYDAYEITPESGDSPSASYTILVRALGKPGGMTTITTCAEFADLADLDEDGIPDILETLAAKDLKAVLNDMSEVDPEAYMSIEQVGVEVIEGKKTWTNVTAELTSIVFKFEYEISDGVFEVVYLRVPIFDESIENEFWEYGPTEEGGKNVKLLQVRIYDTPTDLSYADDDSEAEWNK